MAGLPGFRCRSAGAVFLVLAVALTASARLFVAVLGRAGGVAFVGVPAVEATLRQEGSRGAVCAPGRCSSQRPQLSRLQALPEPSFVEAAGSTLATGALFFAWGSPAPLGLGVILRRSEDLAALEPKQAEESIEAPNPVQEFLQGLLAQFAPSPLPASPATEGSSAEPAVEIRSMMWAFPSFGVFLQGKEVAPQTLPEWARWLFVWNVWAAIAWYLYYKVLVEEELRERYGLGIGGYLVVGPLALGLAGGIYGQLAYGSLTGEPDIWTSGFYLGFLWIYVNQFFLYQKVNKLYTDQGISAPLDEFGLLIPGWNFVTGIRQIHFLADHWAREAGLPGSSDAFCELFPFATKPTLSFVEFVTTPSLWIRTDRIFGPEEADSSEARQNSPA